jgi:hypothetical protein
MMAALFLFFAIALLLAFFQKRRLSILFILLGLVLLMIMFGHHATDTLKINM